MNEAMLRLTDRSRYWDLKIKQYHQKQIMEALTGAALMPPPRPKRKAVREALGRGKAPPRRAPLTVDELVHVVSGGRP
jgi:hypothetical protein